MSDTNFEFSSSQDIYDYTIGIKVYPNTVVRNPNNYNIILWTYDL